MTFKRGIHIEVDEATYRTIQQEVEALNSGMRGPKISVSRFVKTLVDQWVETNAKEEVAHGKEG